VHKYANICFMTSREPVPEDIVRDALPEQTRNCEAILQHWTGAVDEYFVSKGQIVEITEEQSGSMTLMATGMGLTADFIDTMTGRNNGLTPLTAFTDAIDALPQTTSDAIIEAPPAEQSEQHYKRQVRSERLSRLLNTTMACDALLSDASRGERLKPGIVLAIPDNLKLRPETIFKFTVARRAQQSLKEGVYRIAGDKGIEAAQSLVQSTLLTVDGMLQLEALGNHLASLQLDIPNQNVVLKSQAIRRAFAECLAGEDKLMQQLLKTGYVNPRDLQKHRTALYSLTDRMQMTHGIPADSEYVQGIQASKANNLIREREVALDNARALLGYKTEEEYTDFLHAVYVNNQRAAAKRLAEWRQDSISTEEPHVIDERIPATVESATVLTNHDAEQIAELRAQHEEFMQALADLRQPYQPSTNLLKASGLRDLQHDLRNGFEDIEEGIQMEGVTRGASQQVTQMLHGLGLRYSKGGGEEFRFDVAHDLANEIQLVTDIQALRNKLLAFGQNGFDTLDTSLCDTFEWLGTNKSALQAIIASHMPEKAAFYNHMLDELLDMSSRYGSEPQDLDLQTEPDPDQPEDVPVEPEIDDYEGPDLDVFVPLEETDVARQLDWEIFPPEVTLGDIRGITEREFRDSDAANIEWSRIGDLLEIAKAYSGEVYRAKPRSLGTTEPYFVVKADVHGKTFVIAENPQYGNATYILRTDRAYDGATWKEVLEQSRAFARLLGAERIIHSDKSTHLERIMSNIQSQLLLKAE
jgi:hypothetical protein